MKLILSILLATLSSSDIYYAPVATQRGLATVYFPGDGHSGKECADGAPFTKERCHVAHRTWPLGSRVRVCYRRTGRCALSYVGDRGPYGACRQGMRKRGFACKKDGWFVKVKLRRSEWITRTRGATSWTRHTEDPGGQWRGILDMSRCVHRKIGGGRSGMHTVTVERLRLRSVSEILHRAFQAVYDARTLFSLEAI